MSGNGTGRKLSLQFGYIDLLCTVRAPQFGMSQQFSPTFIQKLSAGQRKFFISKIIFDNSIHLFQGTIFIEDVVFLSWVALF
jgi:hypothetical protein